MLFSEFALTLAGAVVISGFIALVLSPMMCAYLLVDHDHQGNIGNGTIPILGLDMWEHAFYLQYKNVKGDWVEAFWKIVNWADVANRFAGVRDLDLSL